jgi:MFS family permease
MASREWRILSLLVVSIFINYIDRSNLSIAAPVLQTELGLSPAQMGGLLGSFFWTYALLQLFGIAGWFADRFDVTTVLAWGFLIWSLSTALTPVFDSYAGLFAMRLLLVAGESLAYPCYSKILARYFPEHRRGVANALLDAGSKMGPALGTLAGGMLIAASGWRPLFLILGLGGLLWLIPWFLWRPRESQVGPETHDVEMPSIAQILGKRSAWGTIAGHFCANYFWFFLLTWLPLYLVQERGMAMTTMASVSSLAFFVIAIATVIAGYVADRWISRGGSVTLARKTMTVSGLLFSTIILPVAVIRDGTAAVALLMLACVGFGVFVSSHWAITQTLAGPVAAGRWTSLQNGVANLSGIAAAWLTGVVVEMTGQFYLAFALAAVVVLLGAALYAFVVGPVQQVRFEPRIQTARI